MPIAQGQCTIFKKNLLSGLENFAAGTPYTYNIALYTADANIGANTLTYTASNEVSGTGYTAGGQALTISQVPTTGDDAAYVSFANAVWTGVSFTCRGALIYNATTGAAVCVLNFGSDKTASNSFTITFPVDDASNAVIRFS